jgi:hypothetical protein
MNPGVRNLLVFLAFLSVVTLLVGSQSKGLDLFLGLGLYLTGSVVVLVKVLVKKAGDRDWRSGWGNQLAALPRSWQRWLLDETDEPEYRKRK